MMLSGETGRNSLETGVEDVLRSSGFVGALLSHKTELFTVGEEFLLFIPPQLLAAELSLNMQFVIVGEEAEFIVPQALLAELP